MVKLKKKKAKRLVARKNNYTNLIIMIILIIAVPIYVYSKSKDSAISLSVETKVENKNEFIKNESLIMEYNECLKKEYKDDLISEDLSLLIEDLNSYLKNQKISVMYVDKDTNFNYTFNNGKKYNSSGVVNLLLASYIYEEAISGNINLDDMIKYVSKYSNSSSKALKKYNYNTDISVRDLVKYMIRVNDNAAYNMLLDYIGGENVLKDYEKNFIDEDTLTIDFTNISLDKGILYLKKLDKVINKDNGLGEELKSYFINSDANYFKTNTIEAASKYAEYGVTFNELGIIYDNHNYYLVVLSNIGSKKAKNVFQEINDSISRIHDKFYSDRISYCTTTVYGH